MCTSFSQQWPFYWTTQWSIFTCPTQRKPMSCFCFWIRVLKLSSPAHLVSSPSLPTSSSTMWKCNDYTVNCYLCLIIEVFTVLKTCSSKDYEQNWRVPAVAFKVRCICCRKIKVLQATKRRIAFQRGQIRDLLKQKTIARTMLHMSSRVSMFTRSLILPHFLHRLLQGLCLHLWSLVPSWQGLLNMFPNMLQNLSSKQSNAHCHVFNILQKVNLCHSWQYALSALCQ